MTWTVAAYVGTELASRTTVTQLELNLLFANLISLGWREAEMPWNDTRVLRDDAGTKLICTVG